MREEEKEKETHPYFRSSAMNGTGSSISAAYGPIFPFIAIFAANTVVEALN